jgi:hypothetical protein
MSLLLDSFWRAVAYCVHPRVIALSFLPLVVMVALSLGLGYLYWQAAIDWVYALLEASDLLNSFWSWLQGMGAGNLKTVVAPLIVIFAVTPVIVVLSLLVVALMMAPALVSLVAERRFATWSASGRLPGSWCLAWSLGSTLLAGIALVVSTAAVAGPAADPGAAAADLGLADLPRHDLRRAGRARQRRGAARDLPPPPHAVAGHRRAGGYLGAAPSLVWASARCSPRLLWCWCRWRSGSTPWCSRFPRSGFRTTGWPRWSGCGPSGLQGPIRWWTRRRLAGWWRPWNR